MAPVAGFSPLSLLVSPPVLGAPRLDVAIEGPESVEADMAGRRSSSRRPRSDGPVTRSRSRAKSPSRRPQAASLCFDSALQETMKQSVSWAILVGIVLVGLASTLWGRQTLESMYQAAPTNKDLAEIDSMLRKSAKWMQTQLDLIDMKIGKEVSNLKKEVEHMMDAEAFSIQSKVQSMKAQMESIESALSVLQNEGVLTKQETKQLVQSVADERALDGTGKALSLDDVRVAAKRVVEEELERHRADGLGRPDYALATGGGRLVGHSEAYFYTAPWSRLSSLLPGEFRNHPKANKVLEPSFGEPGQCLPLKGSNVYVDIRLRRPIHPDAVTLEHVSPRVAYDTASAPRDFRVFGWLERASSKTPADRVLLGEFTYDLDGSSLQTFKISPTATGLVVNTIRLHVLSNYGSETHTCLYRIRVHGTEARLQALL